jgi:N-acetylneuraminate synthase/N,N'-diacetyllegionaminate synthase
MTNLLHIGPRQIGARQPTFVIAEIGVNHDGSLSRALELVHHARHAGADAVKLQIFSAQRLMHGSADFASYQHPCAADDHPQMMLERLELPRDAMRRVVDQIVEAGMIPLATPFSPEDVRTIQELELPAIKIASPDLVNAPLLNAAAASGKPLLLSTGAATMDEVNRTVARLSCADVDFALLHCVSSYPTSNADANLRWIEELTGRFGVPVGFSDHTTEPLAGALAVAAGACIVEKHLTYDRAADGPDHAASADPEDFQKYVAAIRLADQMLGATGKRVLDCELDVRRVSRQSLVAARDINAGVPIGPGDLTVQRPGTGVPAGEVARIVGCRPRRSIPAGTLLQWDMLSDAA